jgi:hypothetical protein
MLMISSRGIAGLGAASPAITALQNALVALAQASGRPAINPGQVDGVLGPNTMNALAAGLQVAADKIPKDSVVTAVTFALALGSTSSQAIATVNTYAPQLTILIKTATAAYATGVLKPALAPVTDLLMMLPGTSAGAALPVLTPTPWYKTWWGIGAIAVGAIVAYKVFLSPKTTAQES